MSSIVSTPGYPHIPAGTVIPTPLGRIRVVETDAEAAVEMCLNLQDRVTALENALAARP